MGLTSRRDNGISLMASRATTGNMARSYAAGVGVGLAASVDHPGWSGGLGSCDGPSVAVPRDLAGAGIWGRVDAAPLRKGGTPTYGHDVLNFSQPTQKDGAE